MKLVHCLAASFGVLLLGWGDVARAQEAAAPLTDTAAPSVPVAPLPPTIAEFTAKADISDVAVSPSGSYFAFVLRRGGASYIIVRETRNEDAKPVVRNLGSSLVYGLKWINDDSLVYSAGGNGISISVERNRIVFGGFPRLYATGHDLAATLTFFKDDKKIESSNVIDPSDIIRIPGDSTHFLVPLRVGRNLDLVRVDTRDGTWTTVAGGAERTVAWFADLYGNPIMRFDTNRRYTEVRVMIAQHREKGRIDWKQGFTVRFDKDTQQARDFEPLAPGPQPALYYVLGRPAGDDRTGIWLYDIDEQRYTTEVFSHPRFDVDGGIADPLTGDYIGATYWDDTREISFLEGKLQRHFEALESFFQKERNVTFLDRSLDRSIWVLFTNGPRDPGTYHLYDMANAHNEVIGSVNPRLTPDRLGRTEAITYKARDGLDITGYITLPPNMPADAKPPLIVYPHGGPELRTDLSYDAMVQFLATRGYAVFQPNFRGSAGYGKAFVTAGDRHFGDTMQTDIMDGVQLLMDQGRVDPARMCIFGASYGGYAALMGAVLYPDLYRCVVSAAGVTDLYRQVSWEHEQDGEDSEGYRYWVAKMGDPRRDKAAMIAASPASRAAEIRIPVLLLHGKKDDTVPFEQSDLMQQALRKAGKTQKLVVYDDADHNLFSQRTEEAFSELEAFFAAHLKTP